MTDAAALIAAILTFIIGPLTPAVRVETRQVTPPPPPTIAVPDGLRCPEWFHAELDAGWTIDDVHQLDRIMWRESRCQATATHRNDNGSIDRGLMQMNSIHLGWLADYSVSAADLLVPESNLWAARLLYDRDGWSPWRPLP